MGCGEKMILEFDPGFWERTQKWFYGAGIAAAGAILTYLNAAVFDTDFTYGDVNFTPFVVAGWSAAVQAVRKFFPEIVVGTKVALRLK